mgnify:CR=1 FL=1
MSEQEQQELSEGIVGQSASTAGLGPLPCPFCGGTDIAIMDGSTFRWVFAACQDCGGASGEVRVQTSGKPRKEALVEAGQRAIVEWNTRSNV